MLDDLMTNSEDNKGTMNTKTVEKVCWKQEEEKRQEELKAQRRVEHEVCGKSVEFLHKLTNLLAGAQGGGDAQDRGDV